MEKENNIEKIKRGYLRRDFEFFHLKDKENLKFESHYHDFNKIIIFISGNVTYLIEGKAYKLKPWDILLVNSSEIHKPLIDPNEVYERIIIWVNPRFLMKHSSDECNLSTCFEIASKYKINLMRINNDFINNIKYILYNLEDSNNNLKFGSHVMKNSLFLQFMVYLNRLFLENKNKEEISDVEYDKSIQDILNYINENLSDNLSIDNISVKFYMSKYYLMHKFKKQTGYTIHSYILKKRLIMSSYLIRNGKAITEVFTHCGFSDYSSFFRAFKKMFGVSPRDYYKTLNELEQMHNDHRNI